MADIRDRGPNGNWLLQAARDAEARIEAERLRKEELEQLYVQSFGTSVEDAMPGQSNWLAELAHETRWMHEQEARLSGRIAIDGTINNPDETVIHVDFQRREKGVE